VGLRSWRLASWVCAAGISGTSTPGAAAAVATPGVGSGRITGTPPAAGSRLPIRRYNGSGTLSGVAATSASNAWAVGGALILHWNGKTWKRVPSPSSAAGLSGVAATSATNAWAVGGSSGSTQAATKRP
jgi:hypothetical protein